MGKGISKRPENSGSQNSQKGKLDDGTFSFQNSRIWFVLNQPFTLFILTSIFLAGITTLYQSRERHAVETSRRTERILRLSYEIGHRVSLGQRIFAPIRVSGPDLAKLSDDELRALLEQLRRVDREFASTYLFPEYAKWTLEALVRAAMIEAQLPDSAVKIDSSLNTLLAGLLALRDTHGNLHALETLYSTPLARTAVANMILFKIALMALKDDPQFVFRSKVNSKTGEHEGIVVLEPHSTR